MIGYYYKFIASQDDGESIMEEFNYLADAIQFGTTFLECSPDHIRKPAFTIVRVRKEDEN